MVPYAILTHKRPLLAPKMKQPSLDLKRQDLSTNSDLVQPKAQRHDLITHTCAKEYREAILKVSLTLDIIWAPKRGRETKTYHTFLFQKSDESPNQPNLYVIANLLPKFGGKMSFPQGDMSS